MPAGQPKPAFYVVVGVVVVALIGFAIWRSDIFAPKAPKQARRGPIDPKELGQGGERRRGDAVTDRQGVRLQAGRAAAAGQGRPPPTSRWTRTTPSASPSTSGPAGHRSSWPTTASRPGKVWKTPDGKDFKVELVLIDNPVAMRDAYAAGDVHIGWATLDMVPLFMEGFVDKQRQAERQPRSCRASIQQVDWSNGGDGIVVRENIKTVGRPARQEDGAGPELAVALLRPEHAGGRRRAAVRSADGLHRGRVPGRRRVQRPEGHRRLRLLGAGHLQPGEGPRQPHAGDHGAGQQADRRRLVRPRRLRQGPPRHHRGPGPRHLRRHGRAEGRSAKQEASPS